MPERFANDITQVWGSIMALLPVSILARLLHHQRLYRLGRRRRFWSVDLLWELPTAVFCAIGGGAASQFLGLDGIVSWGVVGAVSWLGPRGMEVLLARWFKLDPTGEPRSADEAKKEGK